VLDVADPDVTGAGEIDPRPCSRHDTVPLELTVRHVQQAPRNRRSETLPLTTHVERRMLPCN
jgi:hypothetical protein